MSAGKTPVRNKTRKARQEASGSIPYDVSKPTDSQYRETGGPSARKRAARSRVAMSDVALSGGKRQAARGTLGPSGLPMLRTSERGTFKRCRFLYQLEYIDMLKPNFDTPPLMFGSMIHIALAGYYKKGIKRGPHPAGLFEAAILAEAERVGKLTKVKPSAVLDGWTDRVELGLAMLHNYTDHYGSDDEWKVIATELPFKVVVNKPSTVEGANSVVPWFWYTGILDLLIQSRKTGKKLIRDHKTTAAIQTKYLALDDQTTSYWTYGVPALQQAGFLGPKEIPDGLEFNFLRKAKPDERPFIMENGIKYFLNKPTAKEKKEHGENFPGSISLSQPAPYFRRETMWRQQFEMERLKIRVHKEMLDMERVRRDPAANVYKTPGQFTCPGCWAFDICELHEIGADYQSVVEQTTHIWDPYAAHEIYAGETR